MRKSLFISFLFLLVLFVFSVTSHASEVDLPPIPEVTEQYTYYMLFEQNNNYGPCVRIFASDTPFEVTRAYIKYEWVLSVEFSDYITCYTYVLNNTKDGWKQSNTNIDKNLIDSGISGEGGIYSATFDIYRSKTSDEIFFSGTLPEMGLLETIMKMIALEMPEVGTKTIQAMKTILLCGVGCLVLLIALPLLSKVFLKYRH